MNKYYFVGIGGIGMSALARFFLHEGAIVGGYDLRRTDLTDELSKEGADINYIDEVDAIAMPFRSAETIVVYTPAIPKDSKQMAFFRSLGCQTLKRAEVLGLISDKKRALCVAGTHGKTTTSTLLAHIMKESSVDCSAFLGGISNNHKTNLLLSDKTDFVVVEADEFDRSFHHLKPYMSIITSADPDHLDIYGTEDEYRKSFEKYTSLIQKGGVLVMKYGINITPQIGEDVSLYTYALDNNKADFYAYDVAIEDGQLFFTWHYPYIKGITEGGDLRVELGVPLMINVENATAAMALALFSGVSIDYIKRGVASFRGAARRFDRVLNTKSYVLIDDYAHHPKEIEASIGSVRKLYSEDKILGIFQPHLYSRTKDFYKEFADSLSVLDEIILLDIYPARELPIEGVSSEMIADIISQKDKTKRVRVVNKNDLIAFLQKGDIDCRVVLMLGAGDIDKLVLPVKKLLEEKC